ncbi:DUF262 domain-containing protein [Cellulomonas biazotea]|uniref:DUF262 domain-containing protein n=1 Tax=Cellulomonas biazotea TaxID=1709 RepID=A0A402DNC9_9CELL|nr:DUF262 domain-containing protein [Cellulomonas biazotea]GCE75635.1 hypothetical protein CBZ_06910 [Cellulomonas biazotea]
MPDLGTPLEQVLQDKLLNVGDYQRPYAWEEKQLSDLWADIDLLGSLPHYTGTLVLQDMGSTQTTRSGQVLTLFDVVDGQQRLTTCVILLDRLRRALRDQRDPDAQEAAHDLDRLVYVNVDGVRRPRLELGGDLREFFADSIIGDDAPEGAPLQLGARRLLAASRYFDNQIADLTADVAPEAGLTRLLALRARVSHQLRFLVYSVDRSDEVGVLFETVNGRGKPLTELERVKNYLLYLSRQLNDVQRDDVAANINRSWSTIFSNLGRVGLRDDALLRAHWLVTQDANTRNWHGADSVKAKFPRSAYVPGSSRLIGATEDAASPVPDDRLYLALDAYINSLRKSAGILADVHDPAATYPSYASAGSEIAQTTAALRRSGSVASFHPLLLATRLAHAANAGLYLRVVHFCERFSARVWAIRGLRSNAGESSIRWAARDMFTGTAPDEVLAGLEQRLWHLAPDEDVVSSFGALVQWYPRSTAHKFVLYEYELSKQRDASDLPQFGDITAKGNKTTEHILPQTPASDSAWWKSFTPEQHAKLVHGIGNLVLTRDNSRYGNRDYLDSADGRRGKRGREGQAEPWCYYSESNLARERELAIQFSEWTPATIERRASDIAAWALTRWPARRPAATEADIDDDRLIEDEEVDTEQDFE